MTAQEQDRQWRMRRVAWVSLLLGGLGSWWLLIKGVLWIAHRLGGAQ